jgi:hypothetical protein
MLKNKIVIACCGVLALSFGVATAADHNDYHDPTSRVRGMFPEQDLQSASDNPYGFKIDSIIIGKDRKIVSINGHHLQIGDKIDDATVMDIYQDSVHLQNSTGEFIIHMPGYDIKKNSINHLR